MDRNVWNGTKQTVKFLKNTVFFTNIASDLIQRLRACSAEERKAVAMELARTGSDEAVQQLIREVERVAVRFGVRDDSDAIHQLAMNIKALGETKYVEAFKYLENLCKVEIGIWRIGFSREGIVGSEKTDIVEAGIVDIITDVKFPFAPRYLKGLLEYHASRFLVEPVDVFEPKTEKTASLSEVMAIDESTNASFRISYPCEYLYRAILAAKEKLELSLQKYQPNP